MLPDDPNPGSAIVDLLAKKPTEGFPRIIKEPNCWSHEYTRAGFNDPQMKVVVLSSQYTIVEQSQLVESSLQITGILYCLYKTFFPDTSVLHISNSESGLHRRNDGVTPKTLA